MKKAGFVMRGGFECGFVILELAGSQNLAKRMETKHERMET